MYRYWRNLYKERESWVLISWWSVRNRNCWIKLLRLIHPRKCHLIND
jgi:hypothetical protein